MPSSKIHTDLCGCSSCSAPVNTGGKSRKDFLKTVGAATAGLGLLPVTTYALNEKGKAEEMAKSQSVQSGKVQRITLLHTADIHGQVTVHDEFFWENNKAVFKREGALGI